jgi:hypothetical protein
MKAFDGWACFSVLMGRGLCCGSFVLLLYPFFFLFFFLFKINIFLVLFKYIDIKKYFFKKYIFLKIYYFNIFVNKHFILSANLSWSLYIV